MGHRESSLLHRRISFLDNLMLLGFLDGCPFILFFFQFGVDGVGGVGCTVWSVECGVWSVDFGVWSARCRV